MSSNTSTGRIDGVFAQRLGAIANLTFTRQKNKHIALMRLFQQLINRAHHRIFDINRIFGFIQKMLRTVADLNRVGSTGHFDDGCQHGINIGTCRKMFCKLLWINRRRRDDHFQVRPPDNQALHITEQKINIQGTLMRLVDNQRVVLPERRIAVRLREQDAVCHYLDEGRIIGAVVETNFVGHRMAARLLQFLGKPGRQTACSDPSRLGAANHAVHAAPQLQTNLRQLGCLAGTSFTAQDHHLMLADQFRNLVTTFSNGQCIIILGARQAQNRDVARLSGRIALLRCL